ncbi:fatty acid--CoA ligase [Mycobacterium sp.]|jgi:fatty-acyl-CoA synthase|uniref:fatty acid--CoA ligase n=1 Tax=Mycobacterium sp. TaxID=1785 RepID=UPI002D343DD4|nr:fatty acid--CoA ligase [Mycobacterium sp.]HZA09139.1 fatty acid--CoA ligase [Mycobacterium sp.]
MQTTMMDFPLTVTSILRYGSTIHADRMVMTATDGGFRDITFGQLGSRAAQLANGLRRVGVSGDDRVATFLWNTQEHLETYFAAPCMGAVLHTLNIRLAAEQIAFVANDAEDRVILVDLSLADQLADVLPQMPTVHTVIAVGDGDIDILAAAGKDVVRYEELLGGERTEYSWPDVDEKSAAAMCYTSGTTGNPKGVVYSHRSTYLHSTAVCSTNGMTLCERDRVLPCVPMFHANGWGLAVAALVAGADIVLPNRYLQGDRILDMIEKRRVTLAAGVPTIWNDVLHCLESDPARDISSLRLLLCGGSAVPESLMRTYQDKFGVTLMQLWGMTETSPLASLARPPEGTKGEDEWTWRRTAGRPMFGVEMRVVDDEGNVLPNDGKSVGELEVRGPWVTGGYYGGRDSAKFADGWLSTGDVGKVDARGYVTLTDRAKDVIKSGGEWISSVELENHIMDHPAVLEAAVVGVPDDRWQERPLVAVVLKEQAEVTAAELRNYLRDRVVRWWLPERWTFIDQVPRTSVGKFDKKVIRAQYAEDGYDVVECRDD